MKTKVNESANLVIDQNSEKAKKVMNQESNLPENKKELTPDELEVKKLEEQLAEKRAAVKAKKQAEKEERERLKAEKKERLEKEFAEKEKTEKAQKEKAEKAIKEAQEAFDAIEADYLAIKAKYDEARNALNEAKKLMPKKVEWLDQVGPENQMDRASFQRSPV